jgi:zeaxanthin epoxidase
MFNSTATNVRILQCERMRPVRKRKQLNGIVKSRETDFSEGDIITRDDPLNVVVAGGGLAGLLTAINLRNAGMKVTVVEKAKAYLPLGGPIQLAPNGLGTLKAIDGKLFEEVHKVSRPFWGTESGLNDGISGEPMFKFDAITDLPEEFDLPFAVCIDRSDLQKILLENLLEGAEVQLEMSSAFVSYETLPSGHLCVELQDGRQLKADLLVGADGIWSRVRSQMFKELPGVQNAKMSASFTGFKLYSGLPLLKTKNFFKTGYRAFLGPDNYFVICPDKFGFVQWYAFVKSQPNSEDKSNCKDFLLREFTNWCPEVTELIEATNNDEIGQRDVWDRPPSVIKSWACGNVVLVGDSCHATMPNIGQGCGLAFEDSYLLVEILKSAKSRTEIPKLLQVFYKKRILRTAIIQGLGRLNSEAIKILTPLLPIRSIVDMVLGPILPLVFRIQFAYCYLFCPEKVAADDSIKLAKMMSIRHEEDSEASWRRSKATDNT